MANMETNSLLRAKIKTKNTINRLKHGLPKFQEVLRQRCRQRMREKRRQLFDERRYGSMETDEEVHDTLTEIVRSELSQLATMVIDDDKLFSTDNYDPAMTQEEAFAAENDILAEEEQWILREYERVQRDEAEMLSLLAEDYLKPAVFCPLCQKGSMTEAKKDTLTCSSCNLRLTSERCAQDFGQILENQTSLHSLHCGERPTFVVLPENDTSYLYLTCETCLTFSLIA